MKLSKKLLFLIAFIFAAIVFSVIYTLSVGGHYSLHSSIYVSNVVPDSYSVSYEHEDVVKLTDFRLDDTDPDLGLSEVVFEFDAISKGATDVRITFHTLNDDGTIFRDTCDAQLTVNGAGIILETTHHTINFQSYQVLLYVLMIVLAAVLLVMLLLFIEYIKKGDFGYRMIACVGFGIFFGILLLFIVYKWLNHALKFFRSFLMIFMDIGIELFLFVAPLMLLLSAALAVSNIRLLRHEGYRPVNALGIAFAVVCMIGISLTLTADLSAVRDIVDPTLLHRSILYLFCYFGAMFIATIVCAFLSTRFRPPYDRDYIIILGCGIRGDGTLTPLLQGRVDVALAFEKEQYEKTGKHAVFVPSGGQGSDEVISESRAMTNYLLEQGVPEDHILMEDKSVNTLQNMQYSKEVIEKNTDRFEDCKIAFATTNYHVFRGYIYAKKNGFSAKGISAKTKRYFYPNAFLREFVGLLVDRKYWHIAFIAGTLAVFVVFDSLL